jgi:Glycosyltransferases involved in cell wall biogenesis
MNNLCLLQPVVIAARNEEDNLPSILDDLVNQKIDKNKFEVIIANDRSVDNTEKIINEYSNRT